MQYQKILVTGGAGFIGAHLVDELINAGYAVRVMDTLGPPTHDGTLPPWLNGKAEFLRGDVRNKEHWRDALEGVDAVVHLAAYMDYHLDFSTYVNTNIQSIALLFELIVEERAPIKKIIAASSQAVYGEGKYQCATHGVVYPPSRTKERLDRHEWDQVCPRCGAVLDLLPAREDDVLSPQTPYGISKLTSEQFLMNLSKRYNIPAVALRYSIAVGPWQSFRHFYSGALRQFTVNALSGEPIAMNEDGRQQRDFIHVCDVARAHLAVLNDPRADFEVFNVGGGVGTPVMDLAKMVAQATGVGFVPSFNKRYRIGDARYAVMDISKLKQLGWKPERTLADAVGEYIAWVKQFGNLKQTLEKTNEQLKQEGILKS